MADSSKVQSPDQPPEPMPVTIGDYLAYFNLAPQELDTDDFGYRSPAGKIVLPRSRPDPWGATVPAPETALRAGRRLGAVLELPRDQPFLDLVLHALSARADRTRLHSFYDIWIVLHAMAVRVVRDGRIGDGGARLRVGNLKIDYPAPNAYEAWFAAREALDAIHDMVLADELRSKQPLGGTAASDSEPAVRGRGGRPRSATSHVALVANTLLASPGRRWSYAQLAEETGIEPEQVEKAMPRLRQRLGDGRLEREELDGRVFWRFAPARSEP